MGIQANAELLVNTIKVERARRDLTQEQLADMVGVTRKTINTVERGIFTPSTILALKLARALETTVEELFKLSSSSMQTDGNEEPADRKAKIWP